jgi:DNA-binding transcriptional LysR family regulator
MARGIDQSRYLDGALARQRHPHGGARLVFADRPQGVSITLTRPHSVTTESPVRKSVIGVGRRNQAVAIRYGREHSAGLKFEPLVAVKGLPVCAPALVKAGLKHPDDLSRHVLIHLTTQPRAWPVWLKEAGLSHLTPRGHLWLDSVPAMLEAAEQGLGVTLGMAPLIRARPGFGRKLVAPFAFEAALNETIYLVSRTEQARDRRIAAVRRWIVEAVGRASGG